MDRATYLEELIAAYQAEVWGEAIFSTLADHAASEEEREIWRTLTRLESTMRRRLLPLMERHGLNTAPDEEQRRRGRELGERRVAAGFSATIESMTEALPPFVARYARLEAEGLPEDRHELAALNAHEVALYEFAKRAQAGDGRESLAAIKAFLEE